MKKRKPKTGPKPITYVHDHEATRAALGFFAGILTQIMAYAPGLCAAESRLHLSHWTEETIDHCEPWPSPALRAMTDSADRDPKVQLERIMAKGRRHLANRRESR